MEENQEGNEKPIIEEEPIKAPEEKEEEKVDSLKETTEKLDRVIYEKRTSELKELEAKLDKKMKDFRELVEDAEVQGVTMGGQQKPKEKEETPKEYTERVMKEGI